MNGTELPSQKRRSFFVKSFLGPEQNQSSFIHLVLIVGEKLHFRGTDDFSFIWKPNLMLKMRVEQA
jgi:hypothetical protein